jgi:hypothetical protein
MLSEVFCPACLGYAPDCHLCEGALPPPYLLMTAEEVACTLNIIKLIRQWEAARGVGWFDAFSVWGSPDDGLCALVSLASRHCYSGLVDKMPKSKAVVKQFFSCVTHYHGLWPCDGFIMWTTAYRVAFKNEGRSRDELVKMSHEAWWGYVRAAMDVAEQALFHSPLRFSLTLDFEPEAIC